MLLLCKILDDSLSFVAPLILGDLVYLASLAPPGHHQDGLCGFMIKPLHGVLPEMGRLHKSAVLAALLFFAAILKAVVTTQYTYNVDLMAIRAYGALLQAPLCAALRMPAHARGQFSEGAYHVANQLQFESQPYCSCGPHDVHGRVDVGFGHQLITHSIASEHTPPHVHMAALGGMQDAQRCIEVVRPQGTARRSSPQTLGSCLAFFATLTRS